MADPSVSEFEQLGEFVYAQVRALARARGRLSHFEDRGLRFQAQVTQTSHNLAEHHRQESREAGKAWLAQHNPDRVLEVAATLASLAQELVALARAGHLPPHWLGSVYRDLLRAARLWEDAEGFRPEWKYVPGEA